MSKLQNNFTTPEQSKRLLELGVPADSADCYLDHKRPYVIQDEEIYNLIKLGSILPCWSVDRLMEIYGICSRLYTHNMWLQDALTCILADIEFAFDYGNIDFSKLEE
jgi:hypothetical protein